MFCSYYKLFYFSINCIQRSCIPTTVPNLKKEFPTTVLRFRSDTPTIPSCPLLTTHSTISERCIPTVLTNKFRILFFPQTTSSLPFPTSSPSSPLPTFVILRLKHFKL